MTELNSSTLEKEVQGFVLSAADLQTTSAFSFPLISQPKQPAQTSLQVVQSTQKER